MRKFILPIHQKLYRYCVGIEPPQEWSPDFKNPEYVHSPDRVKNGIGAYFFYTNRETAIKVAACAKEKLLQENPISSEAYITECNTTSQIELFDLQCKGDTTDMLNRLYDEGIDVLTNKYVLHDGTPFEKVRSNYFYDYSLSPCPSAEEINEIVQRRINDPEILKTFFRIGKYSRLGQYLTDYSNGIIFKGELISRGYEGYIFDEEQSSPTICLFDTLKLSPPQHEKVTI
jgi:hypothetical protein